MPPCSLSTPRCVARPAACAPASPDDLQILDIGGAALVQDDEIDRQALQPPVLAGAQQLADDARVLDLVDAHQHDRHVARDALRPQRRRRRRGRAGSCPTTNAAPDWRRARARPGADRGWPAIGAMSRWRSWTCACVQASVAARSKALVSWCLSMASSSASRDEATMVQKAIRAVPPAGIRSAPAQREHRIEHRPDGIGQPPPVDHGDGRRRCRCRGRGSARGRSRSRPRRRPRPRRPPDGRPTVRPRPGCGGGASPGWRRLPADIRSARTSWRRPGARHRPPAAPARSRRRR